MIYDIGGEKAVKRERNTGPESKKTGDEAHEPTHLVTTLCCPIRLRK
jgi:hypothetical protein